MFESGIVSVLDDILISLTTARVELACPSPLPIKFRNSSYHVLLEVKCELMSHFIFLLILKWIIEHI